MTAGDMVRLAAGDARVVIDVVRGGRLASWTVGDRELLLGAPAPGDASIRWGCFLMAPWPGRLADGRFRRSDGVMARVPRTHGRHAIHGLVWDRPWTVEDASQGRVVLTCQLPAELWAPGGTVRHEVRLAPRRLDLLGSITAASATQGDAPVPGMPAALGWHPWFRREAGSGEISLLVDASEVLETVRMIPTGATRPVGGTTDLRDGPRLGRRRLDHAYVAARSPAVLAWPDLELEIAWDPSPSTLVVHTPANGLCVEPQTAWPNAPALEGDARRRSGLGLLRPGEALTASMSVLVRSAGMARGGVTQHRLAPRR